MNDIKFYALLGKSNEVRDVICNFSVLSEDDLNGYQLIDTNGYNKSHFASDYLLDTFNVDSLYTNYEPNFKFVNGKLQLYTEEEKQKLFRITNPQPTEQEKMNANIMREIANLKLQIGGVKNV